MGKVGTTRRTSADKDLKPTCAAPALLRAAEVAEWIGSTEAQVRNMRARAQLPPPVRIPGLGVRWLRRDLEKWLAQLGEQP